MSIGPTIGLFALGVPPQDYDLPHPPLGVRVILLVRRVLLRAFEQMRADGFPFASANEDEITAALRGLIENNFRQRGTVPGFNCRTFDSVVRQGQVANYDFTRLTKTPDLCFKLRHDDEETRRVISEFDALFIECKPVDATHAAGGRYCDEGLQRFVEGSYAWAMREGMMLAYARNGRTIAGNLVIDMQEPSRATRLQTTAVPSPLALTGAAATKTAEALHVSFHRRGFPWIHEKGFATDITIYHCWHNCGQHRSLR